MSGSTPWPGSALGDGYALTPGVHGLIARRLDGASKALDAKAAGAPPAPDAGICSAAVAARLTSLTESLTGVVEGLSAAADAVVDNLQVYEAAEQASTIKPHGS
jgi:hypothetical protein